MAIGFLVASSGGSPSGAGAAGTSSPDINTTGASLLIVCASDFAASSASDTVSDNKSNNWHTLANVAGGSTNCTIWYAYDSGAGAPLVVGAGHTVTLSGAYVGFTFSAFSGTKTDSTVYAGNTNSNSTVTFTGTLTTGNINSTSGNLLVTVLGHRATGAASINNTFALDADKAFSPSVSMAAATAHKISTGAAENPTWTSSATADAATRIAEFVASAGTTASLFRPAEALTGLGVGGPFFKNPIG